MPWTPYDEYHAANHDWLELRRRLREERLTPAQRDELVEEEQRAWTRFCRAFEELPGPPEFEHRSPFGSTRMLVR